MQQTAHRTYTIEQIKEAHEAAEGFFFSPGALRFFSSRIGKTTYGPDSSGVVYFTTSERKGFDDYDREFTVRSYDPHGEFPREIGNHGTHETRDKAVREARRLAAL